jgi:hypothetical protein
MKRPFVPFFENISLILADAYFTCSLMLFRIMLYSGLIKIADAKLTLIFGKTFFCPKVTNEFTY